MSVRPEDYADIDNRINHYVNSRGIDRKADVMILRKRLEELRTEFNGHHDEHHENFASHTHPDLMQLPDGGSAGQVLYRTVNGYVWADPNTPNLSLIHI